MRHLVFYPHSGSALHHRYSPLRSLANCNYQVSLCLEMHKSRGVRHEPNKCDIELYAFYLEHAGNAIKQTGDCLGYCGSALEEINVVIGSNVNYVWKSLRSLKHVQQKVIASALPGKSSFILEQKQKRRRFHWVHREPKLLFTLKRQQHRKEKNCFRSDINEP